MTLDSRDIFPEQGPRRCSLHARSTGENVIGTGREVERFLFIEVPRPWNQNILQTDHFPEVLFEIYQESLREGSFDGKFLGIRPDVERSTESETRLIHGWRPEGPASRYEKRSYHVPDDQLEEAVSVLLLDPDRQQELEEYREGCPDTREIMVCTHGERDPCCGDFGRPIYTALRHHYGRTNHRTWEVSHIGGHRFCPNIIELPGGRYWGRLTLDDLDHFVYQSDAFRDISSKYRGWCFLGSPEQVFEKTLFEREGWDWRLYLKEFEILETTEDPAWIIRVDVQEEDGTKKAFRGVVRRGPDVRRLASPCGEDTSDLSYQSVRQLYTDEVVQL